MVDGGVVSEAQETAVSWDPEATRKKGRESRRKVRAHGFSVFLLKGVMALGVPGQLLCFQITG